MKSFRFLNKFPKKNFSFIISGKAELPKLDYTYSDLEPVLSAQLVELHYSKHHKAYVDNYNRLISEFADAQSKGDLGKMVQLTKDLKFNGGSHINHSIYWKNLAPVQNGGGKVPSAVDSPLINLINKQWGNVDNFKTLFSDKFMKIQGSGWANLAYCQETNQLEYVETKDQDPVQMVPKKIPLLVIDAWEHAWYPKYLNEKKRYITEIWKIINWSDLEARMSASGNVLKFE